MLYSCKFIFHISYMLHFALILHSFIQIMQYSDSKLTVFSLVLYLL
jgi:hypothetical protein